MVTGVVPSSPRFLPSIFIAHRIQQSHCSSIFHRVLLTHALALSASQFVHKKKSPRTYTSMHSWGFELTTLTYTRLEDNLILHRGDRLPTIVTWVDGTPSFHRRSTRRAKARDSQILDAFQNVKHPKHHTHDTTRVDWHMRCEKGSGSPSNFCGLNLRVSYVRSVDSASDTYIPGMTSQKVLRSSALGPPCPIDMSAKWSSFTLKIQMIHRTPRW